MAENTFSQKPQPTWTYYGGGHPEIDLLDESAPARCMRRLGVKPGRFVAQARAYAHGEATANTLVALDNGVIAAAGTNTARGKVCLRLPANLRPSAISVTNGNEFALVTAWNVKTLRGELVVIALGGRQRAGDFWGYEWSELYPGFRNYGMPTFAKLLGTVKLPVAAPTAVSAVSDHAMGDQLLSPDGSTAQPGEIPLSVEANRRTFIEGVNAGKRSTAGYAVVLAAAERKTVFVDLQPLFDRISDRYLGARPAFQEAVTRIGMRPADWPRAFSKMPSARPKVVKTVTTGSAPSAVAGMLSGAVTPRAYVATRNGRLHTFDVGGLASTAPAGASQIVRRGSIAVGRNPTGITYVKDRVTGSAVRQSLNDTLIVTARGDRAIRWVRLDGRTAKVIRTLRDSRLVDPIAAEDNNTHGTESYLLTVADYGAARVLSYRYGPVIFHTNGGERFGVGRHGTASFEFGGSYSPQGRPFSISVTNVT